MATRMVSVSLLWLATAPALAADEPAKMSAAKPKAATAASTASTARAAQLAAKLEADAKELGVTTAELKQLRDYGYSHAELMVQIQENKRTARELINERAVVDELARAMTEVTQRVYKMPEKEQASEREKALKDAVSKIRRERKASRDELRQILSKTSFLSDDQIRRVAR